LDSPPVLPRRVLGGGGTARIAAQPFIVEILEYIVHGDAPERRHMAIGIIGKLVEDARVVGGGEIFARMEEADFMDELAEIDDEDPMFARLARFIAA
jgi:hypothetical protein